MKKNLKNSFFREKLYISLNSSICKNPSLNIKKFHPIKTIYSPIYKTENNFFPNETENKDINMILNERKKGSYKISSKRNFKTIIFQNWNTKNNVPSEIGNFLNFPVIMDRKKIIQNYSPKDNININNLKYEYYYPVSNRKDLILPSEKGKEKKNQNLQKYHSYDKGWKLITNYFYKNKRERDRQKRQLIKMKLTAENLSISKNKDNLNLKKDEKIFKDDNNIFNTINNEKENENKINEKMNKTSYNNEKVRKKSIRTKSKSIKILDLEKIEEKRNKNDIFNNNILSNASSSIPEKNKISENQQNEKDKEKQENLQKEENENNEIKGINDNHIIIKQQIEENSDLFLDTTIDWETFDKYKYLENNEFLYAIRRGKPLSYYLIDFKELKKINEIEMKEKYYKHKLKQNKDNYTPKHSQDIFIINYMTISSENVIIYINGKPENYNVNEFKSLYLNYKTLTNIPIFKYWTRSKIFKLWLNYVQRQRRKKYEKKLKEKMHILDKPVVEGIINIKQLLRELKEINIFRLNSREAKFPTQFILDYQRELLVINKEFDYYRTKIKEVIRKMCEEEVHNFMVKKKMLKTRAVEEDNKLLMKIETQIKDNNKSKNNKSTKADNNKDNIKENNKSTFNKENEKDINDKNKSKDINKNKKDINKDIDNDINEEDNLSSNGEGTIENQKNENDGKFNYKLKRQRDILKNIDIIIPEDIYKSHITNEEKFRKQLNDFIKNETNYAQLSTKRSFYCIILRIIRIIDHFFNEAKKDGVIRSLAILNKKIQKYYEFYKNNLNIFPLLKISIITIGNNIKFSPEFNILEELFFEKFIQENIFNFINK